jgi:hypothetical protein
VIVDVSFVSLELSILGAMAMATMVVIGRSSWQQGMMHYVRQQHPWSMHMQRFSFSRMSQLQRWDQLELSTKPIVFQATIQVHPFFKQVVWWIL